MNSTFIRAITAAVPVIFIILVVLNAFQLGAPGRLGETAARNVVFFLLGAIALPTLTLLFGLPGYIRKIRVSRRNPGALVRVARVPDRLKHRMATSVGPNLGFAPAILVSSDRIEIWTGTLRLRPALVFWRANIVAVNVVEYQERFYSQATGVQIRHPNGSETVIHLTDPKLGASVATRREVDQFVAAANAKLELETPFTSPGLPRAK